MPRILYITPLPSTTTKISVLENLNTIESLILSLRCAWNTDPQFWSTTTGSDLNGDLTAFPVSLLGVTYLYIGSVQSVEQMNLKGRKDMN